MEKRKQIKMKTSKLFMCFFLFGSMISCGKSPARDLESSPLPDGFIPFLTISGDVETVIQINKEMAGDLKWTTFEKETITLPAVDINELIQLAVPRDEAYTLLLVGSDGLASAIEGETVSDFFVAFSEEFSWECVTEAYPISSRIKMLQEIIVLGDRSGGYHTTLIEDGIESKLSVGEMAEMPLLHMNEFEGKSKINNRHVTVFTPHKRLPTSDFLNIEKPMAIFSRYGNIRFLNQGEHTFIEQGKNTIDFLYSDGLMEKDIAGIMVDPPLITIGETATDALYFLEQDIPVMIIELDGWGYNMHAYASNLGITPFLSSFKAMKALSSYPPISPVGLATMVTGKTPEEHGIINRDTKELLIPDIFELASQLNKESVFIEGDAALIKTSITPILSPDLGGKQGTDDEVFQQVTKSLENKETEPYLLMAHFHGIDDVAHDFGPYDEKTMEKMTEIDGYIKELADNWAGKIIITADHGLHLDDHGGDHGIFTEADMVVPYIICNGGKFTP